MTFLSKWRNSIAVLAVSAMLVVASVVFFTAAGDVNEASDSIAQISGLETAVDGVDTGWSYMVRADALAATGEAPEEARVLFDTGLATYEGSKLALASVGIAQIDQALAGTDQGLASLTQSFEGTMQLAEMGDVASAAQNHVTNTLAVLEGVQPAIVGLGQIVDAANLELGTQLNDGGTTARQVGALGGAVAAFGILFAAWTAWSASRRESEVEPAWTDNVVEISEERAA